MSEPLIQVANVSKKYCRSLRRSLFYGLRDLSNEVIGRSHSSELRRDEFWAVKDVEFELHAGECLGLIGHNGAGKTSLLKMLNGLMKPDRGRITLRGRIGAMIALGAGFNPILTGRENVYVNGAVLGFSKRQIDAKFDEIVDFAGISEFIDSPVQNYSSGMNVRLGFAIAAKTEPDILLLDEVLAVGDVAFQAKCFNALSEFRKNGTAFVLVSHNMHHIARHATRVLYLKRGEIAAYGDTSTTVELFLREMDGATSNDAEAIDWTAQNGSGKVTMTGAKFLNTSGEETKCVGQHENFSLVLQYEINDSRVSEATLDIVVQDSQGLVFQGATTVSCQHAKSRGQNNHLVVDFKPIPINSDKVHFFLALLDQSTGEIYDWKRHIPLAISNSSLSQGRLALDPRFNLARSN